VEPFASWTGLSEGALIKANIPRDWRLSQGFLSCLHAKRFFRWNGLAGQLKDAVYPITMRSGSTGRQAGASVVLPIYCSNMTLTNFVAPKEYLVLPDNAAVSSSFQYSVNNNQSAKTVFPRLRVLPDVGLVDLNAEATTVFFNNAGAESISYRALSDLDCDGQDTANESILDLRNSAYRQNLRFSANTFLQVSTRWRNKCSLTLDETKQLLSVNALEGNCAACSVTYVDQGTGSLGSPLSFEIANNATALDTEVDGLDPRLISFREDSTGIRRRAIRLEVVPGTFSFPPFFFFFFSFFFCSVVANMLGDS
jgi:hypothetical protein